MVVKKNVPFWYCTVKQALRSPSALRRAGPVIVCPQTGRDAP